MCLTKFLKFYLCACLSSWLYAGEAFAADRISFIRDTEIENIIRTYTTPLFKVAELDSSFVRIHLIKDNRLNAFVAGGQNIFIHTGLLRRTEHSGQVIGVLSHEIGHISRGHLSRLKEKLTKTNIQSFVALALAIPATVVTGDKQVGAAIIAGTSTLAQRSLLQYSRTMESSADQAAISFLEKNELSSEGMLEFLELLFNQETLYSSGSDPYLNTHPITLDRIKFFRNHMKNSKFTGRQPPPEFETMHRRMRGKLNGFLEPPYKTLEIYSKENLKIEAQYARTIAFMRQNNLEEALNTVDQMLRVLPSDPYFLELKGDILRNSGHLEDAILPYQQALSFIPWAALIRANLAQVLLGLNQNAYTPEALKQVNEALRYEPDLIQAWHLAAVAYGRLNDRGNLALALAEKSLLQGRNQDTHRHVKQAMQHFPVGSSGWLRAQDISNTLVN